MFRPILTFGATLMLALPVAAQDAPARDYDGGILTACLAEHTGDDRLSCIGKASDPCMDSSTVGMVGCLAQETDQWDGLLNAAYQVLTADAENADKELEGTGLTVPLSAPALQQMQRAWIAFRDAACDYEAATWQGGTGAGPAAQHCLMDLTARQALRLKDQADAPR
ncbi:MAG: lysozyme inhibitor LprI family protein [Paracoccus sp. (in: a-proteobacteria)]|nr:lysozyme inhibitor LprI family protein [Paracoccus sp. (in: a-proteobacteria)]